MDDSGPDSRAHRRRRECLRFLQDAAAYTRLRSASLAVDDVSTGLEREFRRRLKIGHDSGDRRLAVKG